MSFNRQVLLLQLLQNILSGLSTDLDPLSAEKSTGSEDEDYVEENMDGISDEFRQVLGRTDIISQTSNRYTMSIIVQFLPLSQHSHQ